MDHEKISESLSFEEIKEVSLEAFAESLRGMGVSDQIARPIINILYSKCERIYELTKELAEAKALIEKLRDPLKQ